MAIRTKFSQLVAVALVEHLLKKNHMLEVLAEVITQLIIMVLLLDMLIALLALMAVREAKCTA